LDANFRLNEDGERTKASVLQISYETGLVVLSSPAGVTLQNAYDSYKTIFFAPLKHVVGLDVSPLGNFLVTFQRPTGEAGEKNLKVWKVDKTNRIIGDPTNAPAPEPVYQQPQKQASSDTWPLYQFDESETFMYRSVTNEVHALRTSAYDEGIKKKLRVKGVDTFSISRTKGDSPTKGAKIAIYCPESKGAPGSVQVYDMEESFKESGNKETPQPTARRSFYRSSRAKLMWNASGYALLAWAFSDVDKTNQNYFGEQSLHYLSSDGEREQLVDLKDGPIHDVKWAPNGQHFVAIHGFMPAKATLFDCKCKPIYDFGSGPRNTVEWNPFSRFLILGGFGNLPGDIEFYDKKADGKCKVIGTVRAPCAVNCSWAPDGRHLLTSTTSPRLRVDNGLKIFHYNGDLVSESDVEILLQVEFGPTMPGTFQDRPVSPSRIKAGLNKSGGAGGGGAALNRPAAYVPPHLKGKKSGGSGNFSLAYDKSEKGPGKIKKNQNASSQQNANLPPGAELATSSKSANKNAKKRAAKKRAQEQAAAAAQAGGGGEGDEKKKTSEEKSNNGKAVAAEEAEAVEVAVDVPKKIRNLEKKLRQIDQLKAKPKDSLSSEQVQKLETEGQLRELVENLKTQL
jgi:translation initiation factor 2A